MLQASGSLHDPILIIGGAGEVGRWATRFLREQYPDVPILIGGRDEQRAIRAAAAVDGASAVVVDLTASDLGLGEQRVSAVATLFTDKTGAALRWAQQLGVGHVNISPSISELGLETATFMQRPTAAPVVLGTEWLVGATSVPSLLFAREFGRLENIHIEAVLDEQDAFGPAANADLERQMYAGAAALLRTVGAWRWYHGAETRSKVRAIDGTELDANVFSPNDVLLLANATGASDIRFDLAIGMSSTRRNGGPVSTEIIINLSGLDHAGQQLRKRHAIVHPGGQMPLTGLGVALVLERMAGLAGDTPRPGLYFPAQLIDHSTYFERLRASGGEVIELEPIQHALQGSDQA
ncbi:NAD(P)-dependent oxidoreductase (plasmid) [Agrobacterium tumefaciens]|uniref:NAD(P)-dependent oxidoreductase n=1 Tax=Agrobacterium tumefaciens TaxID=358 RepID=UPI001BB726A1|nr:NAD(P)-dependent oxidoreductase [Agrobacterium tumefaciens]MDX8326789.1 NAD(P)-dependent oxidoreductase [Agrobacterium tumefaciens]QTQ86154.1 NAD(P)-dependent oxidoreductase [Agrobacterium tumefaciens]